MTSCHRNLAVGQKYRVPQKTYWEKEKNDKTAGVFAPKHTMSSEKHNGTCRSAPEKLPLPRQLGAHKSPAQGQRSDWVILRASGGFVGGALFKSFLRRLSYALVFFLYVLLPQIPKQKKKKQTATTPLPQLGLDCSRLSPFARLGGKLVAGPQEPHVVLLRTRRRISSSFWVLSPKETYGGNMSKKILRNMMKYVVVLIFLIKKWKV